MPSSSSGNSSRLYDYPVQGVPSISDFTNVNKEGSYEFFATGITQTKGWINNVQYKDNCWATATENPIQTDEKVLELRDWFNDWREFRGGHIEWALEKYFQEKLDSRRMEDIVSYHCGDGYISTSQASIQNIYRLDFLTMKQYECKRQIYP